MSEVLETREGPVVTLTLNRPDRRNALSPRLTTDLADAVRGAGAEPDVRVVVLAGAGPAFCAGADLEWMRASLALPEARNLADAEAMREAFEALDTCPKAVIARVHGPATGGGAGLVACADVAVAADGARFAFSEARLGLIPALISPYVLRAIGPGHTRALFASAGAFEAHEALRIGLVHRVVAPAGLDEAVAATVQAFLACGPEAVAASKALVREATASLALPDLAARNVAIRTTAQAQEGIAAFLEKRGAGWQPSAGS